MLYVRQTAVDMARITTTRTHLKHAINLCKKTVNSFLFLYYSLQNFLFPPPVVAQCWTSSHILQPSGAGWLRLKMLLHVCVTWFSGGWTDELRSCNNPDELASRLRGHVVWVSGVSSDIGQIWKIADACKMLTDRHRLNVTSQCWWRNLISAQRIVYVMLLRLLGHQY